MASKDKKGAAESVEETAQPVNEAMVIADTEDMNVAEIAHALAVAGMGEGWEIIVSGSVPYWNPSPTGGEVCAGQLMRRQEIMANVKGVPMKAYLYMVKIMAPCRVNAVTPDGEAVVAEAGEIVSVIERKILTSLAEHVGKNVAIFCDGKGKTKRGLDIWRYRVGVQPPVSAAQ